MRESDHADRQVSASSAGRRAAGSLEAEILDIVRIASGPVTPGQVRERITVGEQPDLSYSTVVTIITRLHGKGLLTRQRAGRGFIYTAVDEASVAAGRMKSALVSGVDHGAVLSRFVSGLSGRDARLLRRLLAEARDSAEDTSQATEQD